MPKLQARDPGPEAGAATIVKLAWDAAKAIVVVGFGVIGVVFVLANWSKLTEMLDNVSRLEGFGVKIELNNKSYVNSIVA